jgi:dipeptidyl aminopeptidase/acylaminoacyl peptidase
MDSRFTEIEVKSSLDGSIEKNLLYYPEDVGPGEKIPLAVCLHSWSFDRYNQLQSVDLCEKRKWALLLPEFRGPNITKNSRAPEACGSHLALQDIIDAVEYVLDKSSIDRDAVFLQGGSGGGHMSLMTGAYRPEMWRGVSSWCPITDLALWYRYYGKDNGYAPHLEACCCGAPRESTETDHHYALRSPMSYLTRLARLNLSVHHGRHDKTVPCIHTINLAFVLNALQPKNFYFEIFDGGHISKPEVAFAWFDELLANQNGGEKITG